MLYCSYLRLFLTCRGWLKHNARQAGRHRCFFFFMFECLELHGAPSGFMRLWCSASAAFSCCGNAFPDSFSITISYISPEGEMHTHQLWTDSEILLVNWASMLGYRAHSRCTNREGGVCEMTLSAFHSISNSAHGKCSRNRSFHSTVRFQLFLFFGLKQETVQHSHYMIWLRFM